MTSSAETFVRELASFEEQLKTQRRLRDNAVRDRAAAIEAQKHAEQEAERARKEVQEIKDHQAHQQVILERVQAKAQQLPGVEVELANLKKKLREADDALVPYVRALQARPAPAAAKQSERDDPIAALASTKVELAKADKALAPHVDTYLAR